MSKPDNTQSAIVWWLGLGQLGTALAARLSHSYGVIGVDPDPTRRETLSATVPAIASIPDAGYPPSAVVLCLPTVDDFVDAVTTLSQTDGSSVSTIINLSTVGYTAGERAEAILDKSAPTATYIECMVTGGVRSAAKGQATLLVGSSQPLTSSVRQLLCTIANRVQVMPGPRTACVAKLVNNLTMLGIASATIEAISVGTQYGLDTNTLLEVLEHGTGYSYILCNSLRRALKDNDYRTGFAARLALKDIGLGLELAQAASCQLPHAAIVKRRLDQAIAAGYADDTFARIATLQGLP